MHETNFIITKYAGFRNYVSTFSDPAFRQGMLNTLFYIALLVPANTFGSLALALYARRLSKRWQDISRIIFYVPVLSAGMIISQVWKWIFNDRGPINWLLGLLHIGSVPWFAQGITAIPVIVFIVAFCSVGGNFIIYLSSISGIDKSIFDASKIDGATQRITDMHIIMPIIAPTILLIAFLSFIQAPAIFENIYALAPQKYAATMAYHIYLQGFQYGKYGMASAQSVILLIAIVIVSAIKQRVTK